MNLRFGGSDGTAWTTSSYGEIELRQSTDKGYVVGNVHADFVEPEMPTGVIGDEMQLTLGLSREGLPFFDDRYNQLRDYIEETTDQIITETAEDGTPWYSEPDKGLSNLVRCKPGKDAPYLRGYWGVITDGGDATNQPFAGASYNLTIFLLARLEEYDRPADVREKFER